MCGAQDQCSLNLRQNYCGLDPPEPSSEIIRVFVNSCAKREICIAPL